MHTTHRGTEDAVRVAGFTLIETTLAIAMLGLFIAMLLVMNSNVLGLLRSSKDNVSASQALQERVEQLRIVNWLQITDADYLANTLLATGTGSSNSLPGAMETLTVSPYPAKESSGKAQVMRRNNSTRLVGSNVDLKNERMVRVDLELAWEGFPKNRQRVRVATAVVAKGGITK